MPDHKHTKPYKKSVFIFRRDLRLDDNTGLNAALRLSDVVIACFIFDPRQVDAANSYRSMNAIQFMIESASDLAQTITQNDGQLYLFYGHPAEIIETLIAKEQIDAIFVNRDYTPFSIARDNEIAAIAQRSAVAFNQSDDLLLTKPEDIQTKTKTFYQIFSAFYKNASLIPVAVPVRQEEGVYYTNHISNAQPLEKLYAQILPQKNDALMMHGGATAGNKMLADIIKLADYATTRDIPAITTSLLSAYLKFGCISIRAAHHTICKTLGYSHPLLRQLYWRDFFTHIAFHVPHIFGHAFNKKYDALTWKDDPTRFTAWCTGMTGFPIVDAGMRQLNTTGFMHNRVRMIVASFLVKDLHIDWRAGERYFAQQLVDYDPAVNNGNWQWCASTGCDSQPYFRIFNPWLQQKKFDPDCVYIKQWVPELKNFAVQSIHNWYKNSTTELSTYPRPIVDHATQADYSKKLFRGSLHPRDTGL